MAKRPFPVDSEDFDEVHQVMAIKFNNFIRLYPNIAIEKNFTYDAPLFSLSSSQLNRIQKYTYANYLEWLLNFERTNAENTRIQVENTRIETENARTQAENVIKEQLSAQLSHFLNHAELTLLLQMVPIDYRRANFQLSFDVAEEVLRTSGLDNKPASIKQDILNVLTVLRAEVANTAVRYTTHNSFLTVQYNQEDGFFPFANLFIRPCYPLLFESIRSIMNRTCVVVIGNPGIGKSTLLRYIFLQYHSYGNTNVFWALENGSWLFCEHGRVISGSGDSSLWKGKDTILLIDGSFNDRFLGKTHNVAVFCSPKKSNYHKILKESKGALLVMPPWSFEEVMQVFDHIPTGAVDCLGHTLMSSFHTLLLARANELGINQAFQPDEDASEYPNDHAEIGHALGLRNSNREIDTFLRTNIKMRFRLFGGRIRILMHPEMSWCSIKALIDQAAEALTAEQLLRETSFENYGFVPSIIYSFEPSPLNRLFLPSSPYQITFSSEYIRDMVSRKIFVEQSQALYRTFLALKECKMANALIGKIFESFFHRFIKVADGINLRLESLLVQEEHEEEESDADIGIKRLTVQAALSERYKHNNDQAILTGMTTRWAGAEIGNFYAVPLSPNAPQVDSIFYDKETDTKIFFQVTVGQSHPIISKHVFELSEKLGWNINDVLFVFVVPQGPPSSKFPRQTVDKQGLSDDNKNIEIQQYVLYITPQQFSYDAIIRDN